MGDAYKSTRLTPDAHLGEIGGIPLVLEAVECNATAVVVHLGCRHNDVTRALDAEYETAIASWAPEALAAKEQGVRSPDPPAQPGAFLNDIPLMLSDDLGTTYFALKKQAAGSGTEWKGKWTFEPGVPATPAVLTIAVDDDGCRGQAHAMRHPSMK